jgi:hypothetical protein
MQVTITLTDREVKFLQKLIEHLKKVEPKDTSFEDVIHDCIATAMFDEGEHET